MRWPTPPLNKIYEALGAVADGRVKRSDTNKNTAKVYSCSRNKFYDVAYEPATKLLFLAKT